MPMSVVSVSPYENSGVSCNDPSTSKGVVDKKRRSRDHQKSIRTFSLLEVDNALSNYDKTIRLNTEQVKTKLVSGVPIPSTVLRELSIANKQKVNLTMRRIALLIESGDAAVLELIDKLCKIKAVKSPS